MNLPGKQTRMRYSAGYDIYIEKAEHKLTELDRLLEEAVANAEIIDL